LSTTIPRIDLHIHSEFSPCSKDTNVQDIALVAEGKGLKRIAITDHGTVKRPSWLPAYFSEIEKARKKTQIDILTGMEVNIRPDGTLAVDNGILRNLDVVIGALHTLPVLGILRKKSILEEYEAIILKALEVSSFRILAHPTGLLWSKRISSEIAEEIIRGLKERGVAVEMNYHHRDPSLEFLRRCIKSGLEITPSSDAHKLMDIGHFEWFEHQLAQIREPINWIRI
jgi:histidinol phosphatase-like PHP family hydrolase